MKLIDANVILRYLLKEPLDQAEKARAVIEAGAFTTMEVMSEVVYVLQKVYSINRNEISEAVTEVASDIAFDEYEILILAMEFSEREIWILWTAFSRRDQSLKKTTYSVSIKS